MNQPHNANQAIRIFKWWNKNGQSIHLKQFKHVFVFISVAIHCMAYQLIEFFYTILNQFKSNRFLTIYSWEKLTKILKWSLHEIEFANQNVATKLNQKVAGDRGWIFCLKKCSNMMLVFFLLQKYSIQTFNTKMQCNTICCSEEFQMKIKCIDLIVMNTNWHYKMCSNRWNTMERNTKLNNVHEEEE